MTEVPANDMEGARAAHRRLQATLAGLAPGDGRRPSRLPGWTVGHVLTHLARNADSHVRMLAAAGRGEVADQYAGGREGRAAEIEAGAGRAESELVDDVIGASHALEDAWEAAPSHVWETGWGRMSAGDSPMVELPFRRWREVEVHHADLGLGFGWQDWAAAYVERELALTIAELPGRLPPGRGVRMEATDTGATWTVPQGVADPVLVATSSRRLLAWLVGREGGPDLPPLTRWGP